MSWPSAQDYNEAIQNPRVCFSDPELKAASPELNLLGLPRPITGGFASVYKLRSSSKIWAVRCFLREFGDQQERYAAIGKHLSIVKTPYIVSFEFQESGILIRGQWYPILKMEWIEGVLLNDYVEKNLRSPQLLAELAKRWALMINALQCSGIGHGDLQHGNILIVNGEIRLIDYDGMFVPQLRGRTSNEVGHRNYQHPSRTVTDFCSEVDNFSAWVIYISLLVLSIDSLILTKVGGGDEFLVFSRGDFEDAARSKTFGMLSSHGDHRIRALSDVFRPLIYCDPVRVPGLDGSLVSLPDAPIKSTNQLPDWLRGHVAVAQPDTRPQKIAREQNILWLFDYVGDIPRSPFRVFQLSFSFRLLNCMLSVVLGAAVVLTPVILSFGSQTLLPWWGMTVSGISAIFLLLYETRPESREVRASRRRLITQRAIVESLERGMLDNLGRLEASEKKRVQQQKVLEARISGLRQAELDEKDGVDRKCREVLSEVEKRRITINQAEAIAIRRLDDESSPKIAALNRQIADLRQQEARECDRALERIQKDYFDGMLCRHAIAMASISGIGPSLTTRLIARGIRTAADISYSRVTAVSGIGTAKARALIDWRDALLKRYRSGMPVAIPTFEASTLQNKYIQRRGELERTRSALERVLKDASQRVREEHERARIPIQGEQATARAKARGEQDEITRRYSIQHGLINEELAMRRRQIEAERNNAKRFRETKSREIFEARWQLANTERDHLPYRLLTFKKYLVAIFR